jgi:hypothetical protein
MPTEEELLAEIQQGSQAIGEDQKKTYHFHYGSGMSSSKKNCTIDRNFQKQLLIQLRCLLLSDLQFDNVGQNAPVCHL